MVRRKICLLSDHHISYNPRLWKEAFFWEKKGFEVVILVMWISETALQRDHDILKGHSIRYENYLNLIPGKTSRSSSFYLRLRKRFFSECQKWLKIGYPWAISYAPEKMIRAALAENADVYSAHLECAFYAGRALIKKGRTVFYDFEDWYSRDYLVPERPVKLLAQLEAFALHHGKFCLAASDAMATALQQQYRAPKKPEVIYNGFSSGENIVDKKKEQGKNEGRIKMIWFSRTVGAYRGLEKMVDTIKYLSRPSELHLLGETSEQYMHALRARFPKEGNHTLHFHPFIPHHQITSFLSQFDLGLAIEENVNDNRKLTITNKILQYLQAGLKIVATDTPGQEEVRNYFPKVVALVSASGSGQDWALTIEELFKRPIEDMALHLKKYDEIFSLEAQEKKLEKLASEFLS